MWKYLIPQFRGRDFPAMLGVAMVGAILAGVYGIAHDLVTFTIGPEYFSKFKFDQFGYADFGFGDRIFAATIGFLASWWVGFVIAWFFARRHLPDQPRRIAYRKIGLSFTIVLGCGLLAGGFGYLYGMVWGPTMDDPDWTDIARRMDIQDIQSFVRVGYIHNASYLGGLIGFIAALIAIRPTLEPEEKSARPT